MVSSRSTPARSAKLCPFAWFAAARWSTWRLPWDKDRAGVADMKPRDIVGTRAQRTATGCAQSGDPGLHGSSGSRPVHFGEIAEHLRRSTVPILNGDRG